MTTIQITVCNMCGDEVIDYKQEKREKIMDWHFCSDKCKEENKDEEANAAAEIAFGNSNSER